MTHFDAVTWMETATATDYATFAPLIMRHADAGDTVARAVVRDAAEQIDAPGASPDRVWGIARRSARRIGLTHVSLARA